MTQIKEIKNSLKEAKESGISSWIDDVSRELDNTFRFFELADELGLVKDGNYIAGIPAGDPAKVDEFYTLENKLDFIQPQIINY